MSQQQLQVSMTSLKKLLKSVSPESVVCIRGRHAIGKSEAVAQFAKEMGLPLVMRRLSQMTEGDLLGLPREVKTSGNVSATSFMPCEWLLEACEKPVVLFLDERNRALDAVKQSVFEICDSRAFYGHKLHPLTRVVIAENVGDIYTVQQCDPAEVSRSITVELDTSVEEWLKYVDDKANVCTIEYIKQNQKDLEFLDQKNFEPNKKYPDRRTWYKLDQELSRNDLFENPADMLFYVMACGHLGVEVGMKFTNFCKTRDKQVSAKDIIKDWEACKKKLGGKAIENAKFVELGTLLGDYLEKNNLPEKAEKQVDQITAFLTDCPPEPRMSAFAKIAKNIPNLKKIQLKTNKLMVETINGPEISGKKA